MNKEKPWFCQDCRVLMEWKDDICYRCPECRTEVWLPELTDDLKEVDEAKEVAEDEAGWNDDLFFIPKKGGGSKSKGRSNAKQLLKKKTTAKIYEELCR